MDIAEMLGKTVISPRNEFEEGSNEKLTGLDDSKLEIKSVPEQLSHDLKHPASKEAVARYQERPRRTGSGDGGCCSVAPADYKKIKENLYKLPRMGYEDLAKELRIEVSVLCKGVDKFFILEEENRSADVKEVFNTQLREKTQETEKEEEEEEDTKETKDLRELALHRVLTYMEWTKTKSFSTIERQHGISLEGQKKIVIFFMEFKESLGY